MAREDYSTGKISHVLRERTLVCIVCGVEKFYRHRKPDNIPIRCAKHRQSHRGVPQEFICDNCGESYVLVGKKKQDFVHQHRKYPDRKGYCEECRRSTPWFRAYDHMGPSIRKEMKGLL